MKAGRFSAYALLIIGLLYAGVCILALVSQRSLIYYPQARSNRDAQVMAVQSASGPVLVSTRPANGADALIYFGGNAEDVSVNLPDFSDAFPNYAIYLLHYPGYGGSAGRPSEKSIIAAAFALFDAVHAQHQNVVVVGRSLGTGVAVRLASQRPVARLVLVTPFDSLADVAAEHFRFLPVRWLLLDKYDSWKYAPQVTAPTKIIAAGDDEIIPRASTERLRTRFREGIVSYAVIPGVGHNTISDSPKYLQLLRDQ
jgi:pimeloyl-ACP methyl ester carboxylesterase